MSGSALALPVAFRDARAADLRLSFDLRPHQALRTSTLHLGAHAVELRVLGASHQVLVSAGGRVVAAETVACGLGGEPLPPAAEWAGRGWAIRFSSQVRTLPRAPFAAAVGRLRDVLTSGPHTLAGVFPGDDLAMTGLRAERLPGDGIAWRTWHAYPQTGELVTTRSSARVGAPAVEESS